jgi:hypothetical protein
VSQTYCANENMNGNKITLNAGEVSHLLGEGNFGKDHLNT